MSFDSPEEIAGLGHELKYVLPAALAPTARLLIAAFARPERPFSAGLVESIYFDDDRGTSQAEKRASDYRKRKVRLRWYDRQGPVFLETKERIGTRRAKRRLRLELDGTALSAGGLAHPALARIDRFAPELGEPLDPCLRPVLHLRYRRERWVAPGGERLCLDWRIEAVAAAPELGLPRREVPLAEAVFEQKDRRRELPVGLVALADLGARRRSFSKFVNCLDALEL